MKRFLVVGTMLFAAGCGGDELFPVEASASCPISESNKAWVSVLYSVTRWDADISTGDKVGVSTSYPGMGFLPYTTHSSVASLLRSQYPDVHERYVVPRNTRMTIELWTDTELHGKTLADTAVVKIDRECDLVVEAAQRGDALPHIENIRWENPYL